MLETGESVKKAAATLSQCSLDGATDAAFIGLYDDLLYLDERFDEAQKLWGDARELNFPDEERTRRQFVARDPEDYGKKLRFAAAVVLQKPGYVLLQPDRGPTVISKTTEIGGVTLERGHKVDFELSSSAKGPFAEHLRLV